MYLLILSSLKTRCMFVFYPANFIYYIWWKRLDFLNLYLSFFKRKLADKYAQSWMYWQYKYYQDITTCTPEGEALFYSNGTACEGKLRVLSRTYPRAVAGSLDFYEFNSQTGYFNLAFYPLSTPASDMSSVTEIVFYRDLFYPFGIQVAVNGEYESGSDMFEIICPENKTGNVLQISQKSGTPSPYQTVLITITACEESSNSCTCV